jgi:N-acetylglucosaminyl-diphospho-decaprenol L-rhamnosyltransferase
VFYNAMLIFFRKHYGHLSMLITMPIQLGIYFRAFLALLGMQMNRMRRSLGFTDKRSAEPTYIFIGGHQMIDRCRLISRRKGLTAAFHSSDDAPVDVDGLFRQYADFKDKILFVFDTDTYTYADILRYISRNTNPQLSLGTFNNKTKIIITSTEILK